MNAVLCLSCLPLLFVIYFIAMRTITRFLFNKLCWFYSQSPRTIELIDQELKTIKIYSFVTRLCFYPREDLLDSQNIMNQRANSLYSMKNSLIAIAGLKEVKE